MRRWRLWADLAIVWFFSLLIEAAVTVVRLIRGRSQDREESR